MESRKLYLPSLLHFEIVFFFFLRNAQHFDGQGTCSLIQDSHEGYDRFKSVSWLNSAIKEFSLSLTEPEQWFKRIIL